MRVLYFIEKYIGKPDNEKRLQNVFEDIILSRSDDVEQKCRN